jgi:hypothetical protein
MQPARTAGSLLVVGAVTGIGVCFMVGWRLAERLLPKP